MMFERTAMLLGQENVDRLSKARVAVFGVGGVGGHVVEALVRSGIGSVDVFDNDTVSESNINRQLVALHSTIGRDKVEVIKERMLDINPKLCMNAMKVFYLPENADNYQLNNYDYIVDAIDTVSAKIELVVQGQKLGIPVISSMGAGNKLNPTMFEVSDIYKTQVDPLARVMRRELKARGIKKLKVVYSKEEARKTIIDSSDNDKKRIPGSVSFVPSVVGLIIASEVIKDLASIE